ncbi:unnamed protein product, partial [Cyprideis torosa]
MEGEQGKAMSIVKIKEERGWERRSIPLTEKFIFLVMYEDIVEAKVTAVLSNVVDAMTADGKRQMREKDDLKAQRRQEGFKNVLFE